ncbi:XTP3-transactivated protein [Thraustotheca clavata]|uniref:dCTP pyrophosphatase 1 n=1 Tax=Thraustotheca clavata TaxID=74557 RepID=A0A1V9ZIF6_9STRA|nr:XTP3-transactivated protein [Thraustotheca clavata]
MAERFEKTLTLEDLRKKIAAFADERNWNQYHTPRNLLLAMTGEVGELCECFQWRGDNDQNPDAWTAAEREHLGEELSDVLIYLIRLADKCNVDLPAAALDKIKKNAIKYPAAVCIVQVQGSSLKYTTYETTQEKK